MKLKNLVSVIVKNIIIFTIANIINQIQLENFLFINQET